MQSSKRQKTKRIIEESGEDLSGGESVLICRRNYEKLQSERNQSFMNSYGQMQDMLTKLLELSQQECKISTKLGAEIASILKTADSFCKPPRRILYSHSSGIYSYLVV
jgi:hypothetical protein